MTMFSWWDVGSRNNVLNTVISPTAEGARIDLSFLGGK